MQEICRKYLFNRLNKECPNAIPNLITRRLFNQRRKLTKQLGEHIRKAIARAIDGGEFVFCIDSKPVKVCQNARANRCAMGKTDIDRAPAWGYCASKNMHYFNSTNEYIQVFLKYNVKSLWGERQS